MEVEIDSDVQAVAEFMQRNVPASRLVAVAEAAAKLAPLLWGRYEKEDVAALLLREPAISDRDPHTRSCATEPHPATRHVGDGSAGAAVGPR